MRFRKSRFIHGWLAVLIAACVAKSTCHSHLCAHGFAAIPSRQPAFGRTRILYASGGETPKSPNNKKVELELQFQLHSSIGEINATDWNGMLDFEGSSPFLQHSWLDCLESTKCASPKTGWGPQHLSVRLVHEDPALNGTIVAFVPMYIKGHSMGEFIFDNAWADAAYRSGIEYYPKLLAAVPFTPATGNRILLNPELSSDRGGILTPDAIRALRLSVVRFIQKVATSNGVSSVHFNFLTDDEATSICGPLETEPDGLNRFFPLLEKMRGNRNNDFLRRTSLQYHWQNGNINGTRQKFLSFEDYLSCFKSKRRITIRRERRRVLEEEGIVVDAIVGRDILEYPGLVERMYDIYTSTVDKMSYWGRRYLTKEFFQKLTYESDFVEHLCFMCARRRKPGELLSKRQFDAEEVFAGTFNIVKDGVFYGRYWGVLPGHEVKNLHFEVCYWSAIEHCIDTGLDRMEPGAGGGDYKWARGFDPVLIHSIHHLEDPRLRAAVAQFCQGETEMNVANTEFLLERSAVGGGARQQLQANQTQVAS